MTSRSLPSLRHAIVLLVVIAFTAGFVFLSAVAAPTDRASDRMSEVEAVRPLAPVSLVQSASLAVSPDALTTASPAAAMPIVRDIRSLKHLRQALQSEKVSLRRQAVHRASVLALNEENVPYLKPLRPALRDLAFESYRAPDEIRLKALTTLYQIAPERTLNEVEERVVAEPSEKVEHQMLLMLKAKQSLITLLVEPPSSRGPAGTFTEWSRLAS